MNDVDAVIRKPYMIPGDRKDSVAHARRRQVDFRKHIILAQYTRILSKSSNGNVYLGIYRFQDFHVFREVFYH